MKGVPNYWAPNITAFHFLMLIVHGGTIVLQDTVGFQDLE